MALPLRLQLKKSIPTAKNIGNRNLTPSPNNTHNLKNRVHLSLTHQFAAAAAHMISSNHIHQTQVVDSLLNSVVNPDTGTPMEYRKLSPGPDKTVWTMAFANDLGRLAQGIGKSIPSGTKTFFSFPLGDSRRQDSHIRLPCIWDYSLWHVDISMPGYITAILLKFVHHLKK